MKDKYLEEFNKVIKFPIKMDPRNNRLNKQGYSAIRILERLINNKKNFNIVVDRDTAELFFDLRKFEKHKNVVITSNYYECKDIFDPDKFIVYVLTGNEF